MSKTPIVQTKPGKVKGTTVKNVDGGNYLAFDGIPYAQPPIGELRFKDPVPLKPWDDVRNLNTEVPKPTQYDLMSEYFTGNEDCLYLNVATKSLLGKRPVMVWIHGGGFVMDTASRELFGPDYFLRQDIVFVAIGYRLGCFGFLNLDLPEASGNQGLKDQVAGLKWVQENIEAFGGDPGNVTIFGESAGSACVHYLTMSPLTKGLYHKVIMQSGEATSNWAFSENPLDVSLRFAGILSNSSVDDPAEALKIVMKASTDQLIKAQRKLNPRNLDFEMVFNFVPSIDRKCLNPFMPEHPKEMAKRGINAPLIIGATSDEGLILLRSPALQDTYQEINTDFTAFLARALSIRDVERVEKIADTVKKFYFGDIDAIKSPNNDDTYVRLVGDLHFYNGIQRVIEIQRNLSTPTYVYIFSYRPSYPTILTLVKKKIKGTGHSDELGAMFHRSCYVGNKGLEKGTRDYMTMERITRMWANFAKTGNPTDKLDDKLTTRWEPITKEKINYVNIGESLTRGANFGHSSWEFWKSILETL